MFKKGTDYLPKTLLCNLVHDGTLKLKCARSHTKSSSILPTTPFKLKLETDT